MLSSILPAGAHNVISPSGSISEPIVQQSMAVSPIEEEPVKISPFFAWIPTLIAIAIVSFVKSCSHETGRHAGDYIGRNMFR